MKAGKLRNVVTFEIKTLVGRDSFGSEILSWAADFREWATVQFAGSREFPAAHKRQSETTARFIIRHRSGIDPAQHRIVYEGRIFDITAPLPDERKTQLIIEASETI